MGNPSKSANADANAGEPTPKLRPFMEKVKRLMKTRGLKQVALVEYLRINEPRVSLWFKGTGLPDAYQAWQIAKFLDVPFEWLIDDDQTGDPPKLERSPKELTEEQEVLALVKILGIERAKKRLVGVIDVEYEQPADGTTRESQPPKRR